MRTVTLAGLATLLASLPFGCHAAAPETVVESRSEPGVTLSYQQTNICEVTPGVKSYSGYITLPATLDPAIQPYNATLFFWFFESRVASHLAPLTVWLQGGPGLASVNHAVSGHNGPCKVKHDSNSTEFNPYSWNDVSNMLYIDQPVQTGFSYDVVTEGYRDMFSGQVFPGPIGAPGNVTYRPGRFGSQDLARTANSTAIAARALTHFLDLWGQQFTQYKRDKINVWSQSYGGHYAPALAFALHSQGRIGINSVGIINGVVDLLIQGASYPDFAVNNTYGLKAYPDAVGDFALASFYQPGGCRDQYLACRSLYQAYDPNDYGNNATVNAACYQAQNYCLTNVYGPYEAFSGRNPFDMGHTLPDPFPPPFATGFLNNAWVQRALGARTNFSETAPQVYAGFYYGTADFVRGYTSELATLLDAGAKVALIHGDRDYRSNWFGGEALSLAIPHSRRPRFAAAGYAPVTLVAPHLGTPVGFVRQVAGFSFARVFQAGHEVPYYQPAAALALFARTVLGLDAATGLRAADAGYATVGPRDVRNVTVGPPAPPQGPSECYVDAVPLANPPSRCTEAQLAALRDGTAVVDADRIVVSPAA